MMKETKIFKRRWLFLFVLSILQIINSYNFAGFGQINNIYAAYFHVTYAQTDWMTIASFTGVVLASPILAALSYFRLVALRKLIIAAAGSVLIAYLCIMVSLIKPLLFPLLVVGQLFNGSAGAILVSIPSIFAALWFPENQIGTAISLNMFGISVGSVLGFLVPVNVLQYDNTTEVRNSTDRKASIKSLMIEHDRVVLLKMYLSLFVISIAVAIFFAAFLTDKPPLPPSVCQAAKTEEPDENEKTFCRFLQETWALFTPTYAMLSLMFGVIFHINAWQYTMMGEMIRYVSRGQKISIPPDIFGGYVMAAAAVCGAVGSIVSGRLADTYQRFKLQAIVGAATAYLFSIGLTLSFYYKSFVAIALCNALFGFAVRICIVPIYELVLEETYPKDESFVSIWLAGAQTVIGIVAAEGGRIIYNSSGDLPVMIFQTCALFVSLVMAAAVKPTYNRRAARRKNFEVQDVAEESVRLISDNASTKGVP